MKINWKEALIYGVAGILIWELVGEKVVGPHLPGPLKTLAYSATQNTLGFGGDGSYHLY